MRPVMHWRGIAVSEGIIVDVIFVPSVVTLIMDKILSKTPLPYATLTLAAKYLP